MDYREQRDFFASAALTGILASKPEMKPEDQVNLAFNYAELMQQHSRNLNYQNEEMRRNAGW
jgi:hypothetical protein